MNGVLERILLDHLKLPSHPLSPDAGIDDAGFDSLAFVELCSPPSTCRHTLDARTPSRS